MCSAIYLSRLFWSESQCFGDIGCRDVRLHLNALEVDGTRPKAPQNYIKKTAEIIIHRPYCEQFHAGSIFFHCTRERGSTHG